MSDALKSLIDELYAADPSLAPAQVADALWLVLRHAGPARPQPRPDEAPGARPDEAPGARPDEAPGARPDAGPDEEPGGDLVADIKPPQPSPSYDELLHSPQRGVARLAAHHGRPVHLRVPQTPDLERRRLNAFAHLARRRRERPRYGRRSILIDEQATAERSADQQPLIIPVFQPALRPALDVALLVDRAESMAIWPDLAETLRRLLGKSAVFRYIKVLTFDADGPEGDLKDSLHTYVAPGGPPAAPHPRPAQLPLMQHQLILVLSDTVGAAWRDGRAATMLQQLGRYNLVTLVQALPARLWPHTALGEAIEVPLRRGVQSLSNVDLGLMHVERHADKGYSAPFPALTLSPHSIAVTARLIGGRDSALGVAYRLRLGPNKRPSSPYVPADASAQEIYRRFSHFASAGGLRLAGLCAVVAPFSIEVMRLVQQAMMPHGQPYQLAEVFLGGLLRAVDPPQGEAHSAHGRLYDLHDPELAKLLLANISVRDGLEVLDAVGRLLASRAGRGLDLVAMLRSPAGGDSQAEPIPDELRPFARATARLLALLGEPYQELTEQLQDVRQEPLAIPWPEIGPDMPPEELHHALLRLLRRPAPAELPLPRLRQREIRQALERQPRLIVDAPKGSGKDTPAPYLAAPVGVYDFSLEWVALLLHQLAPAAPPDLDELGADLAARTPRVRYRAIWRLALAATSEPGNLAIRQALRDALAEQIPEVRRVALLGLVAAGDREAAGQIAALLDELPAGGDPADLTTQLRYAATFGLGQLGDNKSLLARTADAAAPALAPVVLYSLWSCGAEEPLVALAAGAAGILKGCPAEHKDWLGRAATFYLGLLWSSADLIALADPRPQRRIGALRGIRHDADRRTIPLIVWLLRSCDDADLRSAAFDALRSLQAVDELIALLGDPDPELFRQAAERLGKLQLPDLIQVLRGLLDEPDPQRRWAGARGLGFLGNRQIAPRLQEMLGDITEDDDVRIACADALGTMRALSARQELEYWLSQSDDPQLRDECADALGKLGDRRALDTLGQALADEAPAVRMAAVKAIGRLHKQRDLERMGDRSAARRERSAMKLAETRPPFACDALLATLRDVEPEVRVAAARALWGYPDSRARPALEQLLGDESEYVRTEIRELLEHEPAQVIAPRQLYALLEPGRAPTSGSQNRALACGELCLYDLAGVDLYEIDPEERGRLSADAGAFALSLRSPYGERFQLPICLPHPGVPGGDLLSLGPQGKAKMLTVEGSLALVHYFDQRPGARRTNDLTLPTTTLMLFAQHVREPSAHDGRYAALVTVSGVVVEPPTFRRYDACPAVEFAGTRLSTVMSVPASDLTAQVTSMLLSAIQSPEPSDDLEEGVDILVDIGTHQDAAGLLYRTENNVQVTGRLMSNRERRRGPQIDQAVRRLTHEWQQRRAYEQQDSQHRAQEEQSLRAQITRLIYRQRLTVLADSIAPAASGATPISVSQAFEERKEFVRRRKRRAEGSLEDLSDEALVESEERQASQSLELLEDAQAAAAQAAYTNRLRLVGELVEHRLAGPGQLALRCVSPVAGTCDLLLLPTLLDPAGLRLLGTEQIGRLLEAQGSLHTVVIYDERFRGAPEDLGRRTKALAICLSRLSPADDAAPPPAVELEGHILEPPAYREQKGRWGSRCSTRLASMVQRGAAWPGQAVILDPTEVVIEVDTGLSSAGLIYRPDNHILVGGPLESNLQLLRGPDVDRVLRQIEAERDSRLRPDLDPAERRAIFSTYDQQIRNLIWAERAFVLAQAISAVDAQPMTLEEALAERARFVERRKRQQGGSR